MSFMEQFYLNGKCALVTGGTRGLGQGMAEGLCEAGANVIIVSSTDEVFETAKQLREKGHKIQGIKGNLKNREEINIVFHKALEIFQGRIDILINNAGIQRRNKCEEFSLADWDDVLEVNLNAVFQLCQLAGKKMLEQKAGKIINVASMLSFFGGYTVPAYAASKGGVMQLTKALTNEWSARGVHVNAIAPGYMATEMNTNLINDEKRNAQILDRIPIGRWGTPEDIKGITVFLASPASDYINGAVIPVDGGYLVK